MAKLSLEKLKSERRYRIAFIIVLFTCVYAFAVTFFKVADKEISFLVTGYVFGIATAVISFYFSNAEKSEEKEIEKKSYSLLEYETQLKKAIKSGNKKEIERLEFIIKNIKSEQGKEFNNFTEILND